MAADSMVQARVKLEPPSEPRDVRVKLEPLSEPRDVVACSAAHQERLKPKRVRAARPSKLRVIQPPRAPTDDAVHGAAMEEPGETTPEPVGVAGQK